MSDPTPAQPRTPDSPQVTNEQRETYCQWYERRGPGSDLVRDASLFRAAVRAAVAEPPAPQPEAATGADIKVRLNGFEHRMGLLREGATYYESVKAATYGDDVVVELGQTHRWQFSASAPPPPTVETAEGWRSKCKPHRAGTETQWSVSSNDKDTHRLIPRGCWIESRAWIGWPTSESYFPSERAARAALAKAPPPPGVEPAPTVTLPLADAQGLLRAIDAWGLVLKPAIVLREAIERATK